MIGAGFVSLFSVGWPAALLVPPFLYLINLHYRLSVERRLAEERIQITRKVY